MERERESEREREVVERKRCASVWGREGIEINKVVRKKKNNLFIFDDVHRKKKKKKIIQLNVIYASLLLQFYWSLKSHPGIFIM